MLIRVFVGMCCLTVSPSAHADDVCVLQVLSDLSGHREGSYVEAECNLSSYVWTESPGDVPDNSAWVRCLLKCIKC